MAHAGVDLPGAKAAAASVAAALGLRVDESTVLHASNRLALRLLPADVVARVARSGHEAAALEVEVARRLAAIDSPVATLDPRVAPQVFEHDGFAITLWTYYPPQPTRALPPGNYADALWRLHVGLRHLELPAPHFSARVAEAERIISSRDLTAELGVADRALLATVFASTMRAIDERGPAEQLLHGEPHPGNILASRDGPRFIDLETCCRGPVEFDLAHVPEAVSELYPGVDHALLRDCRLLVLAMVAAWRLDARDQYPDGRQAARELLSALRAGPPYPALGTITGLQ